MGTRRAGINWVKGVRTMTERDTEEVRERERERGARAVCSTGTRYSNSVSRFIPVCQELSLLLCERNLVTYLGISVSYSDSWQGRETIKKMETRV